MRKRWVFRWIVLAGVLAPSLVWALNGNVDGKAIPNAQYIADTLWVVVTAVLVFFMQAGFAMLESGFTRAKNAVNVLMKNLMDFCVASVAYWAVGFAIMFGNGNPFVGLKGFFVGPASSPHLFSSLAWTSVPVLAAWFFQLVFAGTAATIVSGAMAERTKFSSYLIYSMVISLIIYPLSGHWIWGGGWLSSMGFKDFAGSTVVHSVGGWLALVGAYMLGPRIGKYSKEGKPLAIPGHNLPIAFLGAFILWLGWFGFNPGSTMSAAPVDIALIATTTNIAAATGALGAMFVAWIKFGKPDAGLTINGAIAGLVAITAPCAFVSLFGAAIIGLLAGLAMIASVLFFDRIKIDDPVGAISVHGVCGALGTLLLGLFDVKDGLFYGGGIHQLGVQAIGVVSVFAWCIVTGFILFGILKTTVGLRVTREEEIEGLDLGEHGIEAYNKLELGT
jgi:Amt family ammonium transporter